MRILYIAHRIPYPPNKGDKIRSFNEIKYLSQFHEIDLVALVDDIADLKYEKDLRGYCKKICLKSIHPTKSRLKSIFFPIFSKPLSVGHFYSRSLQKHINQWITNEKYDAVICFSSPMAQYIFSSLFYGRRIKNERRKQCPVLIMDFCDLDSDKWLQYSMRTGFPLKLVYRLEYKLLLQYEKRINRFFDRSIFISNDEAALFYHLYPQARSVSVVPNGVDYDYFSTYDALSPIPKKEGPVLLFTGAMDYHANVDGVSWFCYEILPKIKTKLKDVQFYIVGSKPAPEVKELEQIEGVHVTGFVEDIRPYYAMADVCVISLRIARGVQNKVLEAMAMGKATVVTSVAVQGLSFDYTQSIMIADTKEEFADKVLHVLEKESIRDELGAKARDFVIKHYQWERNMNTLNMLLTRASPATHFL